MRSEASPHWNALTGDEPGFWSFTKAADIASHQPRPRHLLVGARRSVHDRPGCGPSRSAGEVILGMDPPRHTKHRNIVQVVFTPKLIRQKEENIRATSRRSSTT